MCGYVSNANSSPVDFDGRAVPSSSAFRTTADVSVLDLRLLTMRCASVALIELIDLWLIDEPIQGVCSHVRRLAKAREEGRQKERSVWLDSSTAASIWDAIPGRVRSWDAVPEGVGVFGVKDDDIKLEAAVLMLERKEIEPAVVETEEDNDAVVDSWAKVLEDIAVGPLIVEAEVILMRVVGDVVR